MRKTMAFFLFLVVGAVAATGCDGEESGEPNVDDFCQANACADNNVLRNACEEAYDTCLETTEGTAAQCRAGASIVCLGGADNASKAG